jgi:hypothetical protein
MPSSNHSTTEKSDILSNFCCEMNSKSSLCGRASSVTGETRRKKKVVTVSSVYRFFQFQAYPLTYSSFANNVVSIMLLKLYKGIRGSLCSYQNKKVLKCWVG